MSQEQINRILNSDLSYIDETVSNKINSIEQITGHLNQKTNFLAQFQLMLEKELSCMNQQKSLEFNPTIIKKGQQTDIKFQDATIKRALPFQDSYLMPLNNKILTEQINIINVEKQNKKHEKRQRSIKVSIKQIKNVHKQIFQIKQLIRFIVNDVKEKIFEEKNNIIQIVKQQVQALLQRFKQNKIQQLQTMTKINQQLNQKVSQLSEENSQLKQQPKYTQYQQQRILKYDSLVQVSTNIPKLFNLPLKLEKVIDNPRTKNKSLQKIQPHENTFRSVFYNYPSLEQGQYFTPRQLPKQQTICLPNISILSVGIPPIKNGFGILKKGVQVIYRGMWKNGKFDGKGKLTWQTYSYQGDFVQGHFQGYGKLEIESRRIFWGQFVEQKAEGQGTLEEDGNRIVGLWKQNRLIRRY